MNTKKLLIIYPSTFIWKDNRQVVMYNSQSHMLYYFLCNEITEYYCDHLLDMTNLYVIEIEESHITNGNLIDWLHNIEQLKMGYVDEIHCRARRDQLPRLLRRTALEHDRVPLGNGRPDRHRALAALRRRAPEAAVQYRRLLHQHRSDVRVRGDVLHAQRPAVGPRPRDHAYRPLCL